MKIINNSVLASDVGQTLGLPMIGDDIAIHCLNLCNSRKINQGALTYLARETMIDRMFCRKEIVAAITSESLYSKYTDKFSSMVCFISRYPEEDFYKLHNTLIKTGSFYLVPSFSSIVPNSVVQGRNVQIDSEGVIIGENVSIGANTVIDRGVQIGDNCQIGSNSIIGCDGFQLIKDRSGKNQIIKHGGAVKIGNSVAIGNNTVIARGLLSDTTEIGHSTKIDNLVHISHNCTIGENCVITAGAILAGSVILDNNVWVGPNSTFLNRVCCGDESTVGIGSVVISSVNQKSKVFGNPARYIS
jgi:UDP-3-O-[3-hydroxymyristoyl] glucosamine N-acyltransferase